MDLAGRQTRRGNGQPITRHPLFPAVVALWFGALFGLGSLAVRASLIEELVVGIRLDLIVPAAAPPLGMTARMLLALGLAAFGAMLGAWFGRKLAFVQPEKRERRRHAREVRAEAIHHPTNADAAREPDTRPIEAAGNETAFENSVQPISAPVLPGRRRPLTVVDEEPVFELTEYAPLPGGPPQIFEVTSTGIAPIGADAAADEVGSAPISIAESALDLAGEQESDPTQPVPSFQAERQVFRPVEPIGIAAIDPASAPAPAPEPSLAVARVPVAPAQTPDEPARPFAAAQPPHAFRAMDGSAFDQPAPPPLFATRPSVTAPAVPPVVPPPPIAPDAPLQDLAARLADAMRRRREARAVTQPDDLRSPSQTAFDPAAPCAVAPGEIPAAMRPIQTQAPDEMDSDLVLPSLLPPRLAPDVRADLKANLTKATEHPAMPAPRDLPPAMRPISAAIDADVAVDQELDSLLPPRQLFVPLPATAPVTDTSPEPDDEESATDANDNRFSSLLAVAPRPEAFRSGFVRIEEPIEPTDSIEPVVIFPGQALARSHVPAPGVPSSDRLFDPPTPDARQAPTYSASFQEQEETDRALKLALANLQRMSGVA